MSKYKAAPGAEVIGSQILVTVDALGAFKSIGGRLLVESGLGDVKADQWYPQQAYCDFLEILETKIGKATLTVVGKNVAQAARLPTEIDAPEKWMASAAQVYQHNHRNVPKGEGWQFQMTSPTSAILSSNEPYPDSFLRGLADGFIRRFKKDVEQIITIKFDENKPRRDTGGNTVTLIVNW